MKSKREAVAACYAKQRNLLNAVAQLCLVTKTTAPESKYGDLDDLIQRVDSLLQQMHENQTKVLHKCSHKCTDAQMLKMPNAQTLK